MLAALEGVAGRREAGGRTTPISIAFVELVDRQLRHTRCEGDRCPRWWRGHVATATPGTAASAQTCVAPFCEPGDDACRLARWIASGCSRSCDRGRSDRTPLWFDLAQRDAGVASLQPVSRRRVASRAVPALVRPTPPLLALRVAWRCGPGRCCHLFRFTAARFRLRSRWR